LMDHRLGYQSQTHVTEADVQVQSAGPIPTQALLETEELLNMPAVRKVPGQGRNFRASRGAGEGFVMVVLRPLSGALEVAVAGRGQGAAGGIKALHRRGESSPVRGELLGRDVPVMG